MAAHTRPEPLLTSAHVTSTIAGLASLLVTVGVLPATVEAPINSTASQVVALVAFLAAVVPPQVHARFARKRVTPSADPRNDAGVRLVPAGSAAAVLDAAVALAEADAIHPAAEDPAAA